MEFEPIYPFRYKPIKHHLDIIRRELVYYMNNPSELDTFISNIKELNNNYIDIYTGKLSPLEIIEQINEFLKKENVLLSSAYKHWLGSDGFKKIALTDGSHWILRESIADTNYVHIHPARFTLYSERVYGSAFKTALLLLALHLETHKQDLEKINELRTKYLTLSPLKSMNTDNKIMKALNLIMPE